MAKLYFRDNFWLLLVSILTCLFHLSSPACNSATQFTCVNKINDTECVSRDRVCDYYDDCLDNTDEQGCSYPPADMSTALICAINDNTPGRQYSAVFKLYGNPEYYVYMFANSSYDGFLPINMKIRPYMTYDKVHSVEFIYTFNKTIFGNNYNYRIDEVRLDDFRLVWSYPASSPNKQVNGLAYDWTSNNIYWIDGSMNVIAVMSYKSEFPMWKSVVAGLTSPQDIAVNPLIYTLFIIDLGTGLNSAVIETCDLFGNNRSVLVDSSRGHLVSPTKLTVDYSSHRLYWFDSAASSISSVEFDGSELDTWSRQEFSQFSAFTIYKNYIFFGHSQYPVIYIYDKTNATFQSNFTLYTATSANTRFISDLTMFTPLHQPATTSPCSTSNGGCSELCFSLPMNRSRCDCTPGYFLSPDGVRCVTKPWGVSEDFLLVSDINQQQIYQLQPSTGEVRSLLETNGRRIVRVVTYDPVHNIVYFVHRLGNPLFDTFTKLIPESSNEHKLYTTQSVSSVTYGLCLDYTTETLYYTDLFLGVVGKMKTDGTQRQELISNITEKPRAIIVDTTNSRLYWTDCSVPPSIQTSRVDGTDRRTIVTGDNGTCFTGITADFHNGVLYWTVADNYTSYFVKTSSSSVERSSLNGTGRATVLSRQSGSFAGLTYMDNCLFISDPTTRTIQKFDLTLGRLSSQPPTLFSNITDVKYSSTHVPTTATFASSSTTATTATTAETQQTTTTSSDNRIRSIIIGVCVGGGGLLIIIVIILILVCLLVRKNKRNNSSSNNGVTSNKERGVSEFYDEIENPTYTEVTQPTNNYEQLRRKSENVYSDSIPAPVLPAGKPTEPVYTNTIVR